MSGQPSDEDTPAVLDHPTVWAIFDYYSDTDALVSLHASHEGAEVALQARRHREFYEVREVPLLP